MQNFKNKFYLSYIFCKLMCIVDNFLASSKDRLWEWISIRIILTHTNLLCLKISCQMILDDIFTMNEHKLCVTLIWLIHKLKIKYLFFPPHALFPVCTHWAMLLIPPWTWTIFCWCNCIKVIFKHIPQTISLKLI